MDHTEMMFARGFLPNETFLKLLLLWGWSHRKLLFRTLISLYLSLDFKRKVEWCLLEGRRGVSVYSACLKGAWAWKGWTGCNVPAGTVPSVYKPPLSDCWCIPFVCPGLDFSRHLIHKKAAFLGTAFPPITTLWLKSEETFIAKNAPK